MVRWYGPANAECQLLFGASPDQLTSSASAVQRSAGSGLHLFRVPVSPDQSFNYFAFNCGDVQYDEGGMPFKFSQAPTSENEPSTDEGAGTFDGGEEPPIQLDEAAAPIREVVPEGTVISDFQFVSGEPSDETEIGRLLEELNSPLASATLEPEEGLSLPAAAALAYINEAYSVSPPVLLTILENEYGLLSNPSAVLPSDLSTRVRELAIELSLSFYAHYNGQASPTIRTMDGVETAYPATNAAGYALTSHSLSRSTSTEITAAGGWQDEFQTTFAQYFTDPTTGQLNAEHPSTDQRAAVSAPEWRLPWVASDTWTFNGGPHSYWDGSGYSDERYLSALDFQPKGRAGENCNPNIISDRWVAAAASGKLVEDNKSTYWIKLDHDMDNTSSTGWQSVYGHTANRTVTVVNTYVERGARLGNPSCLGGTATGSHLHFGFKFQNVWQPIDGSIISGWTVRNGNFAYHGYMNKSGMSQRISAYRGSYWDYLQADLTSDNSLGGDSDDNRTITSGQTLNGTINPNNDEDTYFFDASANSRVTIRMTRTSGTVLDSYLELYAPNGSLVTVDDDSAGYPNSLINNWPLSAGGRYKIVARSWSRASSGPYSLNLSLNGSSGGTTSCSDGQYKAEYWNNRSFSGSPTFTRCEGSINNDWGGGGPGNGVGNDNFSVRWTGRHNFPGGNTRFIATADDGIKVAVDNSYLIEAWRDQGPTEYRGERNLSAGFHTVMVEFYENGGGAVAKLRWEQASCSPNADQVALFVDGNHQGQCVVRGRGEYTNPSAIGMPNDSISSVKVGSNVRLSVYEHDGYQGRGSVFTGDDGNLSDNTIGNDSVSSMKVESRGPNYTPPSGYSFCAYENQRCSFSDRRDVAYGANGIFTYRTGVTGGIDCNNATFGDPLSGVYKACFTKPAPATNSGNLALNRSASATSQESSSYSPSRGNDGNSSTRWSSMISSSLGGQRWYVDLGSVRSVNQVRINWEAAYAAQYRIVYSDNGVNWVYYTNEPLYTRNSGGWASHTFSTHNRRYIGVSMYTRAPGMNNFSLYEFEVYGATLTSEQGTGEGVTLEMIPEVPEPDILLPSVQE